MTTIVEQDSAALCERQRILKDEIMPGILNMKRYLGKVNFGDQFQRREKKGLVNWEFDDKETKTTFKPTLLGEIASATYGTLLKGRGNFKPPKDSPTAPLQDGTKAKNIIVLQKITGSSILMERAFLNQTAPLNKIKQVIDEEDERLKKFPTMESAWIDSSAEINELPGRRHLDLIKVNLPKKFGRPPKGTLSSTIQHDVITEIQPLTEAVENAPSTSSTKANTHQTEHDIKVGKSYEPSLLPDYNQDSFQLTHDKLIQYDIRDINCKLIPAWQLEQQLRPGTVVCVTAVLHIYNIQNERGTGFRRFFQIDAEKIWVVAEPLEDEEEHNKVKGKAKEENIEIPVIDDFAVYMNKKRKSQKNEDEPPMKKTKQSESSTEDEMNED